MSAHEESHQPTGEKVSKTAFRASSWLVIILVGLFIAALNFIQVESKDEPKEEGAKTEMPAAHDATAPAQHEVNGPAQDNGASADTTHNHTEEKH